MARLRSGSDSALPSSTCNFRPLSYTQSSPTTDVCRAILSDFDLGLMTATASTATQHSEVSIWPVQTPVANSEDSRGVGAPQSWSQTPLQPSLQQRLWFKRRSHRRRVGDDTPSIQRGHSLKTSPYPAVSQGNGLGRHNDSASQRRRITPQLARHIETKPLPLVRSVSRRASKRQARGSLRLSLANINKPLPPIPEPTTLPHPPISAGDGGVEKLATSPIVHESDVYHEAHSSMPRVDDNDWRSNLGLQGISPAGMTREIQGEHQHVIHDEPVQADRHHYDLCRMTNASDEIKGNMIVQENRCGDSSSASLLTPPSLSSVVVQAQDLGSHDEPIHSTIPGDASVEVTTSPAGTPASHSRKRLESFRFPLRKSPIDKPSLTRLHLHRHAHHQSLPYNTTHSRLLGKALDIHALSPSDMIHHTRSSSASSSVMSSPGRETVEARMTRNGTTRSQLGQELGVSGNDSVIISDSGTVDVGAHCSWKRAAVSEKRSSRRQTPHRHRKSESCSTVSHRPSLSFNSSKKALLSLQDRRINKPDAKVHRRLPDIMTTPPAPLIMTMATIHNRVSAGVSGDALSNLPSSSRPMNLEHFTAFSGQNLDTSMADPAGWVGNTREEELAMVLRTAGMSPQEDISGPTGMPAKTQTVSDAAPSDIMSQGVNAELPNDMSRLNLPAITAISNVDASTLNSALTSALETFTIDPSPVIGAGEIKRFVKRSHALQELETTEDTYVNDLDILMHVYLRILETKSWFPQIILAKMKRCVSGLLALHRDFYAKMETGKLEESDREQQVPLRVYKNLAESFKILSHDNHFYSTFCELRMRTVKEINRSASQAAMALIQRESKELMAQQGRRSSRADLKDFLIKPIQRVCRYPLLLKEILRLTSEDDPEYQYVEQTYQLMREKAKEMDETQRVVERKLLTEQFMKKLPETNFPRKVGTTIAVTSTSTTGKDLLSANVSVGGACNNASDGASVHPHSQHPGGASAGVKPSPGFALDSYFEYRSMIQEGVAPAPLTKAFASTLGSIVLAGALEYVMTPDMPIRLKYYGCFLFDSMLIIVKAKKSSLYEPKQWLPLRLCELRETTHLDGYTRFGWYIVYDQFRIDFGASSAAEQHVWMATLQDRIQAAKDAYSKLPRDIAVFETIVSSLPWKLSNKNGHQCGVSASAGHPTSSARHLQICHQSPSPSPSPWSSYSSAIPSPLMPPPPITASSTPGSTTMMMATSSMVSNEPEKWNARGSPELALEQYAQHQLPLYQQKEGFLTHLSETQPDLGSSPSGVQGSVRIGGMAGNALTDQDYQSDLQFRQHPLSSSSSSSSSHLLYPLTPVMPWLLPESRTRSHSFDVTRVFTSSNSNQSIKPNQRTLVQSMFKDVSTENIWTTTTTPLHQEPSPQSTHSTLSRYGSSSPLNYFHSTSGSVAGTTVVVPPSPSMGLSGMSHGLKDFGEDDVGYVPSSSLTNRLLRRRDSGDRFSQEKIEKERRRYSTTATIVGTLSLNFRKNSDPQPHSSNSVSTNAIHLNHSRSSAPGEFGTDAGIAESQQEAASDAQLSVKARAQMIDKKASSVHAGSSSSLLSKKKIKNKVSSSTLHLRCHKDSTLSLAACEQQDDPSFAAETGIHPLQQQENTLSVGSDMEILDSLSSAGEAARSRRRASERTLKKEGESQRLRSYSSTHSLPGTLRPNNSNGQSPGSLPHTDSSKDNVEKIWSAVGRLMHKSSRSRTNSSNGGESMDLIEPSSSSQRPDLQFYQQHQHQRSLNWSTPVSSVMLRRSSTIDSARSTATSSTLISSTSSFSSSSCSPTTGCFQIPPFPPSSPAGVNNGSRGLSRTDSNSTTQSLESDYFNFHLTGIGAAGMAMSSSPPVLTLTPSVSITTCPSSAESCPHLTGPPPLGRSYSESSNHGIHTDSNGNNSQEQDSSRKQESHSHHPFFQHHYRKQRQDSHDSGSSTRSSVHVSKHHPSQHPQMAPLPTTPAQDRRKTMSILQNITHSASQRFWTLVRSPSGLRRRTGMNQSPLTMEQTSFTGEGTADEAKEEEEEEGQRQVKQGRLDVRDTAEAIVEEDEGEDEKADDTIMTEVEGVLLSTTLDPIAFA
ncbi:T-lymphoma invasion and metastasis-inducing protein 2 [Dissophora globulifera]|nr:T-lymphoma invasion and metastasis-inducing protein 2 [Dissophora globulifera]